MAKERVGPPLTTAGRKKRVQMVEKAAGSLERIEQQLLHAQAAIPAMLAEVGRIREELLISMAPPPDDAEPEPEPASG